jgi:hypothetical protein
MAMPPQGKSFAEFQQDDAICQHFAAQQVGAASPGQVASESVAGGAVMGTVLGAAAGAAVGAAAGNPAVGAAVGAGTGLAAGSVVGLSNGRASGGAVQQRYDMRYVQCMAAKGDQVPAPTTVQHVFSPGPENPYPPAVVYAPRYRYYYGPPPPVAVIIDDGPYWRRGYRHRW